MAGEKRIKVSEYPLTSDPDSFKAFGVRENADGTHSNMLLQMSKDAYLAYLETTVDDPPLTREEWVNIFRTKADHGYEAGEQKKTLKEIDQRIVTITEDEFDALPEKDDEKFYFIIEE